jgi:hypothetical protein
MDRLRRTILLAPLVAAAAAAGGVARGAPPAVRGAIPTTARVVRAASIAPTFRACRGPGPREWTARTRVVERRVGRRRTLTFRSADGRFLESCDSIGLPIDGRRWCAPSTGMLYRRRLRDPRLDLCQARGRKPVAFVWVTPRRSARWIGLRVGRRTELYRVAAGLPVRVASDRNIQVAGSIATFFVTDYDARGRLLGRRTIVARVAG